MLILLKQVVCGFENWEDFDSESWVWQTHVDYHTSNWVNGFESWDKERTKVSETEWLYRYHCIEGALLELDDASVVRCCALREDSDLARMSPSDTHLSLFQKSFNFFSGRFPTRSIDKYRPHVYRHKSKNGQLLYLCFRNKCWVLLASKIDCVHIWRMVSDDSVLGRVPVIVRA